MYAVMVKTTIIFILLMIMVNSNSAQQALPYIYYYDHDDQVIPVEQVDGTDSRIMATVPDSTNTITGAVWSPSGKWFAFGAEQHRKWTTNTSHPNIQSRSSSTILRRIHNTSMAWHPEEDILAVAGYENVPQFTEDVATDEMILFTMRLFLYNPDTGATLTRFSEEVELFYSNITRYEIRGQGDAALFISEDAIYLLGLDGSIETLAETPSDIPPVLDYQVAERNPDGSLILYIGQPFDCNAACYRSYLYEVPTETLTLIHHDPVINRTWSPDSKWLVYRTIDPFVFYLLNTQTLEAVELFASSSAAEEPVYRLDDTHFVIQQVVDDADTGEVYVYDADTADALAIVGNLPWMLLRENSLVAGG
jgi:WD40 repeat protein